MFGSRLCLQAVGLVLNCAAAAAGISPVPLCHRCSVGYRRSPGYSGFILAMALGERVERGRESTRVCLPLDKPVQEIPRALLHPPAVPGNPTAALVQ